MHPAMKFLHAADLHIDSPLRGLSAYEGAPVEQIRGATRRAVENLVDAAISHGVDLVVIAGDVFDGDWKDYSTGLFWIAQLARLEATRIPVVFVAGNHDAASEISRRLRLPPNVTQLSSAKPETKRFDDLNVAVVGQGYSTKAVSADLAAAYPLADPGLFTIGLLHTSLDGRPNHASYAPTTIDTLRSRGYQYWGLGHVHQREAVLTDPWVVFPGNLQGRHARDRAECGQVALELQRDAPAGFLDGLFHHVARAAHVAQAGGQHFAQRRVAGHPLDHLGGGAVLAELGDHLRQQVGRRDQRTPEAPGTFADDGQGNDRRDDQRPDGPAGTLDDRKHG